jgi:hypothetical protein
MTNRYLRLATAGLVGIVALCATGSLLADGAAAIATLILVQPR